MADKSVNHKTLCNYFGATLAAFLPFSLDLVGVVLDFAEAYGYDQIASFSTKLASAKPGETVSGIAVAPDGAVFVADMVKLLVFPPPVYAGRLFVSVTIGDTVGTLTAPTGVAMDQKTSEVFVSEGAFFHNRISVFKRDGTLIRCFGSFGFKPEQLAFPRALAVDDAHVYLHDSQSDCLKVFTKEGKLARVIDTGLERLDWRYINQLCVQDKRLITISTLRDAAINVFHTDGTFSRKIVSNGSGGVMDKHQNVILWEHASVSAQYQPRQTVYKLDGSTVPCMFRNPRSPSVSGPAPDATWVTRSTRFLLALDKDERVFVCEVETGAVSIFEHVF